MQRNVAQLLAGSVERSREVVVSTMLTSTSDTDRTESEPSARRSLFLPRPIILRALEQLRNPNQTSRPMDPMNFIMFSLKESQKAVGVATISFEQANLLRSQRDKACETSATHYHDLKCGHTVTTSTGWPSATEPKSSCASNCKRVQFSKHTKQGTLIPFICPVCLETLIRRNFIKIWKEYRSAGYAPDPDPDVNVMVWVYSSVQQLAMFGLRVTQATSGIFLLGNEMTQPHIGFLPAIVNDTYGEWSFRSRQRMRSRSRSPGRSSGKNRESEIMKREYRDRTPLRIVKCAEVEELSERLSDAKVGLHEDDEINDLLNGVAGL